MFLHLVCLSEYNMLKLGKIQQGATAENKENVPLKKISQLTFDRDL